MSSDAWALVATAPPPQGQLVDTVSPGGLQQPLRREGNLWFFADGSMYVYYTPEKWRPL